MSYNPLSEFSDEQIRSELARRAEHVDASPFEAMTPGQAHVLLDALSAMRQAITAGHQPWKSYTAAVDNGEDPMSNADLYGDLLKTCAVSLGLTLDMYS